MPSNRLLGVEIERENPAEATVALCVFI